MAITLGHIDRREGEEIVLLKGEKGVGVRADLREYEDTALTARFRSEMRLINNRLTVSDILYEGPENVDDGARHLKRVFTRGTFGTGGRLFGLDGGGFWLNLRKKHRLRHLQIDGEAVVSIDFASMLAAAGLRPRGASTAARRCLRGGLRRPFGQTGRAGARDSEVAVRSVPQCSQTVHAMAGGPPRALLWVACIDGVGRDQAETRGNRGPVRQGPRADIRLHGIVDSNRRVAETRRPRNHHATGA